VDGRQLEMKEDFRAIGFIARAEQVGYFIYNSSIARWVIPYHAILIVEDVE
jgi:hypothetical protein